jgi:peroxiredoxin
MTGQPNKALPEGWDDIPGSRGCTPQSCAFRDIYQDLSKLAQVFGLSTQSTEYQQEAAARLHLPFPLLSDSQFQFSSLLQLPMFEVDGKRLIKRLTLLTFNGAIKHCFYPVFPPDKNAEEVLNWLKQHA